MPISFKLEERLAGFSGSAAKKGEHVSVIFRELLAPTDKLLQDRLEHLHSCLFSKIPGLPDPSGISQLAVVIDSDLSGRAYVNELKIRAAVKPNRTVTKGESVFVRDIADIESVDLGISIPENSAVVVVRSFLWKRSLFFDFGPLLNDVGPRDYAIEKTLAHQMLLLLGLPAPQPMFGSGQTRVDAMREAIARLIDLLSNRCGSESEYQVLLVAVSKVAES